MPRYSYNYRPLRRTRKSIKPALCRVSDRTVVRVARPHTLGIRPVRIRQASQGDKGTMRKKTAPPQRKQRRTSSSAKKPRLIAQKKTTGSSERAKSVLDNRSHRTVEDRRALRCEPLDDTCELTRTPRSAVWGRSPRRRLEDPGRGYEGQSLHRCSPGQQSCRGTFHTLGPLAEPEKASGQL